MRKLSKILVVNGFLLLLVAIAVEAVFGNWFADRSYGALTIPRDVTWQFDASGLYLGGGTVTYRRDEHGLRGSYPDPSQIDILTLGGSTTDQRYIDDKETWQAALARRFAEADEPRTIVNAGVDGQSTVGHLYAFDAWFPLIPELQPRYVLAYIGVNDVHLEDRATFDRMQSGDLVRLAYYTVRNNSAIYRLFVTVRGMLTATRAEIGHGSGSAPAGAWFPPASPPDVSAIEQSHAKRLDAYEDRVRRLIDKIRDIGAEAIIVTQSRAGYRIRDGRVLGRMAKDGEVSVGDYALQTAFNRRAMEACRNRGAICIDLGSEIEFADGDFYDSVHTTPVGAEKIGAFLFEKLRDRLAADGDTGTKP